VGGRPRGQKRQPAGQTGEAERPPPPPVRRGDGQVDPEESEDVGPEAQAAEEESERLDHARRGESVPPSGKGSNPAPRPPSKEGVGRKTPGGVGRRPLPRPRGACYTT